MRKPLSDPRPVVIWLVCVCLCILAIVGVGGITRLTGSGLSITDWKPILGAVPPLSETDWEAAFAQYREFPQYQLRNQGMTLDEFKVIYFWEYIHRLLGRVIGIVFLVPYVYFLLRKRLRGRVAGWLGGAFVLGGLQGLLGWYMVKSGLVDVPQVSHLRLTAHLCMAFLLYAYLVWILVELVRPQRGSPRPGPTGPGWKIAAIGFLAVLALQIVYGGFTAGLRAGFAFNTFPTMLGYWVPPGMLNLEPALKNLTNNPTTIQFIHRGLGWLLALYALALWTASNPSRLQPRQSFLIRLVAATTALQFVLGVMTLVHVVPITLATLHQITACYLLGLAAALTHAFLRPDPAYIEAPGNNPRRIDNPNAIHHGTLGTGTAAETTA
jgi:heme a synthase